MNAPAHPEILRAEVELLVPGAPFAGGYFVSTINVNGQQRVLIVAPKDTGELRSAWNASDKSVDGTLSYCDGRANTQAMADAGSYLAQHVQGLLIEGFGDWYLPAQDELELIYRNLKPTADENSLWARSGMNVSAVPPTYAYTPDSPAQTVSEAFRAGCAQAFEEAWYWSSTQRAGDPGYAWMQHFDNGHQGYDHKSNQYRARAVRSFPIQ